VQYSRNGLSLTEQFEGCRLRAYQDQVGVWTIGYGHTRNVAEGQVCTPEQAQAYLAQDIAIAEADVNSHVRVTLTQGEFDALVDFAFNLGCRALETSTLLRLVNSGDFEKAALEFEKWDHAGGKVVAGLLRRRQAEKAEFANA
jgi:lysozyme